MPPSQPGVYAVAIILPTLASVTVLSRFYIRRRKNAIGRDDWMALAGLALTWVMGIILIIGAAIDSFGTTIPLDPQTGQEIYTPATLTATINSIKLLYAFYLTMILALGSIKLSVLLFYRRIFVGQIFKIHSLIMCVLVGLWCLAFFFATVFQCGVHPAYWWTSQYTSEYLCSQTEHAELGLAVSDVILDLLVLAIPIPLIWNLNMTTARKFAVIGIFLLGLLSTAGALTRMAVHILSIYSTKVNSRDILGDQTNIVVWSLVEAGIAVIAACLPTLRPLFGDRTPESIVRSIRSLFSLDSLRSITSLPPRRRQGSHDIALTDDYASQQEHVVGKNQSTEFHQPDYEFAESKSAVN